MRFSVFSGEWRIESACTDSSVDAQFLLRVRAVGGGHADIFGWLKREAPHVNDEFSSQKIGEKYNKIDVACV